MKKMIKKKSNRIINIQQIVKEKKLPYTVCTSAHSRRMHSFDKKEHAEQTVRERTGELNIGDSIAHDSQHMKCPV